MRSLSIFSAAALLAVAGTADAHPKLVSASPAANAVVATPGRVELHFSETLVPQFSHADLSMAVAKAGAKLASASALGPDRRTLIVTPKAALAPGRYTVAWRVVSTDTHRVTGSYGFAVK